MSERQRAVTTSCRELRRIAHTILETLDRIDSQSPDEHKRTTNADRIAKAITSKGRPLTSKEIGHVTGISDGVIRVVLCRESRFIKAKQDGKGPHVWFLASSRVKP